MNEALTIAALLDLSHTITAPYLRAFVYPWETLDGLKEAIRQLGRALPREEYDQPSEDVFIHRTATVAPSVSITGPVIVCAGAEIRHCAFIRGSAVVGCGAVVGNSTELKNVVLFDRVQVPHYNYVGDSLLGYRSHMGAGSITSNVKSDKTLVTVTTPDGRIETGRKKFGAVLGDRVEIGCSSVLNPGTVIGRDAVIYPLSMVRGFVPPQHIYKRRGEVAQRRLPV